MNYYEEIKNKIIDDEVYGKVKDYSKERHRVITYYDIGKLLNDAGGKYGDNIIDKYSKKLVVEVGKKYNRRLLFRMKQFYNMFSNEKVSTMSTQLTWSHYVELLPIKDEKKLLYYLNISIKQNINVRNLRFKIKSKEYERLPDDTKNKLVKKEDTTVVDYIKNPIIIKNNYDYEIFSEKVLQKLIMEDISSFLKELGDGFTFVDNEYKIKLGDRYNYIDILLYNIKFKCYVVVELKVTEVNSKHTGQIQNYMNYIDRNVKNFDDNKTVGIIICKRDNKYVIDYCSDERIVAREYELL